MASYRKYGGTNFSPISNIVRHNIFNSKSSSFNKSGLYNSKENFLSHIDLSGNSLIHVGNLYFQDGTTINKYDYENFTLSDILINGNLANQEIDMSYNNLTNVNSTFYSSYPQAIQTSAYTGFFPLTKTTYEYANIEIDANGKINNIVNNSFNIIPTLSEVLKKDGNASNLNIINVNNLYTNILNCPNNININQSITQNSGGNNNLSKSILKNIGLIDNAYIYQTVGTAENKLKSTIFSNVISYNEQPNFDDSIMDNSLNMPTKLYIDTLSSGTKSTISCVCATTENISISSPQSTIDGFNLSIDDYILVKSQGGSSNQNTNNSQNGVYIYKGTGQSLIRQSNWNDGINVYNKSVLVKYGVQNASNIFIQLNNVSVGNPLQFEVYYTINYNLGNGLKINDSNTFYVDSCLNFLTNYTITNNNSLKILDPINNENKIIFGLNSTSGSYSNSSISSGDNVIVSKNPLTLGPWVVGPNGLRISNNQISIEYLNKKLKINESEYNIYTDSSLSLSQYTDTSKYNLNINVGHTFIGDCYMINNIKTNGSSISSAGCFGYTMVGPGSNSIFNINSTSYYDILVNAVDDSINSALYLCIFKIGINQYSTSDGITSLNYLNFNIINKSNVNVVIANISYEGIISYISLEYIIRTISFTIKGSDIQLYNNKIYLQAYISGYFPTGSWNIQIYSNSFRMIRIA